MALLPKVSPHIAPDRTPVALQPECQSVPLIAFNSSRDDVSTNDKASDPAKKMTKMGQLMTRKGHVVTEEGCLIKGIHNLRRHQIKRRFGGWPSLSSQLRLRVPRPFSRFLREGGGFDFVSEEQRGDKQRGDRRDVP